MARWEASMWLTAESFRVKNFEHNKHWNWAEVESCLIRVRIFSLRTSPDSLENWAIAASARTNEDTALAKFYYK